jgi:TPR repeat protein
MQGLSGNRAAAAQALKELNRKQKHVKAYMMAYLALASGDRRQALDWLERACDERDDWVTWLHVDAIMDPLRSEPRFQAVVRRVGLPPS